MADNLHLFNSNRKMISLPTSYFVLAVYQVIDSFFFLRFFFGDRATCLKRMSFSFDSYYETLSRELRLLYSMNKTNFFSTTLYRSPFCER